MSIICSNMNILGLRQKRACLRGENPSGSKITSPDVVPMETETDSLSHLTTLELSPGDMEAIAVS